MRAPHLPWLLLLSLALIAAPAHADERFALLVGANTGWSNDRPLRYAETDAERMRDTLVQLGGFAPDRVSLLRDPTTAELRQRLAELAQVLQGQRGSTLVFFYYSGHADEQYVHLRGTPLSLEELHDALRDLPATVRLGAVDACRSGSILKAKGGKPAVAFEVNLVNELPIRGLALLTSSGADELSQERQSLAGSVFTHHLVSGLRGAADQNQNGEVTLAEAYTHAYERTAADTAASPVPHHPAYLLELQGQRELVLTWPNRSVARLLLPSTAGPRYVVVDEHETRLVAEGRPRPGAEVSLALAPGSYRVIRVLPAEIQMASLSLAPGAWARAGELTYTSRPLELGVLKGRPEEMDKDERHAWRRGEALRLLAAGEAGPALSIFNELIAADPTDVAASRGRAHALVRMAEAYERVGNVEEVMTTLGSALEADPSLADDPEFARWYRRLREHQRIQPQQLKVRKAAAKEFDMKPYVIRRWGIGLELVGTQGWFALSALALNENWLFHATAGPVGFDAGAGYLFTSNTWLLSMLGVQEGWNLYLGGGAHVSLVALGLVPVGLPFNFSEPFEGLSVDALYWANLHLDAGVYWIGKTGLSVHLEMGGIAFLDPPSGNMGIMPMVNLGAGWFF